MVNTTKLTTHDAPSTPADGIHEGDLREFRSRLAARRISQRTGVRTGSTSRWTCLQFLATKDQLILSPRLLRHYLLFALLLTTTEWLELGTAKMCSTLQVRSSVVATLSRSSLLPEFGRFLMVGPLQKSCTLMSIGQLKKFLSRDSAFN
jgi:hypothetical protein